MLRYTDPDSGVRTLYDPVIIYCSDTVIPTHYPTTAPTNPTFAPTRAHTNLRYGLTKIFDEVTVPYSSDGRRPFMTVYTDGETLEEDAPCVSGAPANDEIEALIDLYDIRVVTLNDDVATDSVSCLGDMAEFNNPWTMETLRADIEVKGYI